MQHVVTAAEMRALDRATIEDVGLPAMTLMETAGRAVAEAAQRLVPEADSGHLAVICGPGNNGGDGFVVARVLRAHGYDAVVYLAAPRAQIRDHALAHLGVLERSGGVVRMIDTPAGLTELKPAIASAELAIDALFGVGLARPISGHLADVVAVINLARRRLAVDIPSGLDSDTGRTLGACVAATATVTLGLHKVGVVGSPGFASCGEVELADIGIPANVVAASVVRAGFVELGDVVGWLPRSTLLDHKGVRGHVLIIGGSPGMRGAGRLAARAALRGGAGLATLASVEADTAAPDVVMTRSVGAQLGAVLHGKAAVVIGCGLDGTDPATAWVREVLAAGIPAVLDAGALHLVTAEVIATAAGPIVITPHPGEAARLLATTAAAVEADRLGAARTLAARTHAVVVLKGARTVVCDGTLGDDHCAINSSGGPALATAGTGDVLAGTIGALLAQGLSAVDAARAGVYVHGAAGDRLCARGGGARGVIASDLPDAIALVIAELVAQPR